MLGDSISEGFIHLDSERGSQGVRRVLVMAGRNHAKAYTREMAQTFII